MVFSYYLLKPLYSAAWHILNLLKKRTETVFYCHTPVDLEIWLPVQKYLQPIPIVTDKLDSYKFLKDKGYSVRRLMICNDSGALHIANAMKVKVFAFFGPTVTSIGYYPYRKGDRVFEVDLDCRPCGSHGGNKCPLKHHNCMQQISVESVLDAIVQDFTKVD